MSKVTEPVTTENRKTEHIRINLEKDVQFPHLTTGLEHYRFMHQALPEINLPDVDTSVKIFDKIGVRFVTKSVFDSFQVIRFLIDENLVSFPQIIPDQSSNNMYPVKEFLEYCESIVHSTSKNLTDEISDSHKIDEALITYLKSHENKFMNFFRKENSFSAQEFKYVKFICRRLIRVPLAMPDKSQKDFQFFYPLAELLKYLLQTLPAKRSTQPARNWK